MAGHDELDWPLFLGFFPDCEPLHNPCAGSVVCCDSSATPEHVMTCDYNGFSIESFEAGTGLWHARIRRADQEPVVIDGLPFAALEVGFAWPDPAEAIAHAKNHIDRFKPRYFGASHAAA